MRTHKQLKRRRSERKMWQAGVLLTILAFVFSITTPVLAYTQNDLQCVFQNTCGYDPTDTTQPKASDCSSVRTELMGGENEEKAWNFLAGKGLSDTQVAGIVGNLSAESSFDPKADNGSHRGIAQWTTEGRWTKLVEWAKQNGRDEYGLDTQLEYLWKEASDRGQAEGIKKYDDVAHTTWYWGRYFEVAIINGSTSEKPLTNVQNLSGRTTLAQRAYDTYGGSSDSISPISVGESDCVDGENDNGEEDGEGGTIISARCSDVNTAPPEKFKILTIPGTSQKTDERTMYMINLANDCLKAIGEKPLTVVQGSYCAGHCAGASGSSHDKGATIDIRTADRGGKTKTYKLLSVLREVGFAAWYRDGRDVPSFAGNEHIHAVALGAPLSGKNAPGSPGQLTLYCSGGDGLTSSGKDRQLSIVGRPLPAWALKVKPTCKRYP